MAPSPFSIRAVCSFFISLNFLHSLKVFHFLFMPSACTACAACLLFALILRSIVPFCRPRAERSGALCFFTFWLVERATGLFFWLTHSHFYAFTSGIKFHTLSLPLSLSLSACLQAVSNLRYAHNYCSFAIFDPQLTSDVSCIWGASPPSALGNDREAANSIADNAICIN